MLVHMCEMLHKEAECVFVSTLYCIALHSVTPAVKHSSGGMIWACFAATGSGRLAVTESTMNFFVNQNILESNVRLGGFWVMQQDID